MTQSRDVKEIGSSPSKGRYQAHNSTGGPTESPQPTKRNCLHEPLVKSANTVEPKMSDNSGKDQSRCADWDVEVKNGAKLSLNATKTSKDVQNRAQS